jgi:uncharacterized protein (DUF1778 family)
MSPGLYELLKRAAENRGLTDFVIAAAQQAAEQTLAEVKAQRLSFEPQQQSSKAPRGRSRAH